MGDLGPSFIPSVESKEISPFREDVSSSSSTKSAMHIVIIRKSS